MTKQNQRVALVVTMCMVSLALGAATAGEDTGHVLACGTGQSALPDARLAGAEAAHLAQAALGGAAPKLVVVFAARRMVGAELVAGVAEVFDRSLVYGGEGYAPVTAAGNFPDQGHTITSGVAVLALGGGVDVHTVVEAVRPESGQNAFAACGQRLGEQLRAARQSAPSRLILTFGNQHVGDNQPLVEGLLKALGTTVPIVGAAAGGSDAKEIVQGTVTNGVNVAVLLQGNFKLGVGLSGGGTNLVANTEQALTAACKAQPGKPALALVFDCGGRRGDLVQQKKIADEFTVMKKVVPEAPIFGFYGGGEIGTTDAAVPSRGVGFHVAAAALFTE
jgi:hypothetical protein